MEIKNVKIGDKFISPSNNKAKRVSEVVDFIEHKSLVTGLVTGHSCIASHEFCGQVLRFETPFASVVRYKV